MQSQSEFAKILEKKLKERSFQQENPSEKASTQGSATPFSETKYHTESWAHLLGKFTSTSFSQTFQSSEYKKFQTPPKPRPANKLSQDQLTAFLFFAAHGVKLEANFNLKDVKRAFRTLAFKMHPDHGGNSQTFLELKSAYDLLVSVFKKA